MGDKIMRIEDLKIFVDVVKYHSMNTAAEKNYTTPQNLSKIIRRMEDELGVVLFKRSKKGSDLTEKGESFYIHVLDVLKRYDEAMRSVGNIENDELLGSVSLKNMQLSVLNTVGALGFAVIKVYNEIVVKYPGLSFLDEEISLSDPKKILDYIHNEKYDIIACYVPQESIAYMAKELSDYVLIHVIFDEMVLAVSKSNPLCNRGVVSNSELKNLNIILFKDFALPLESFELDLEYHLLTNSHANALEQMKASDSYCVLLFKSFCDMNSEDFGPTGKLRMLKLDKKILGTYIIALHRDRMDDECALDFVKTLESNFKGAND